MGDSVVAWIGGCDIPFAHMVDGEDLLAQSPIAGERMLHFIIEKFHQPLFAGVALQRLFAALNLEWIRTQVSGDLELRREGDDLYLGDGKLSISIATVSPVSTLVHFAINCNNRGTPVKTACLEDLGIEPRFYAEQVMDLLAREIAGIEEATVKVRWVK